MEYTEEILNKTCFLVSTFDEREKFLPPFFYFYKKFIGSELVIYLAKGEKLFSCDEDINIRQLNFPLPRTNRNLGLCTSWGKRLKEALKIIKNDGFKYVVFTCDDGWIRSFDHGRFNLILEIMRKHNPDRIQLIETSPGYILEKLDDDVSLISPKSDVPWYLNHQTSIWNLDSLDKLVREDDCATASKRDGSERSKKLGYRFLIFNQPITISSGVNHSVNGLYKHGKEMLEEFCQKKGIFYDEYVKKFRVIIVKKIIVDVKSFIVKSIRKIKKC